MGGRATPSGSAGQMRGMMLIEVLLALGFGITSLVIVANFNTSLQRDSGLAKQHSEASIRAHEQLELLRSFEVIRTTAGKVAFEDIRPSLTPTTIRGRTADYSMSTAVDNFHSVPASGTFLADNSSPKLPAYKSVNLRLAWQDATGANHSISVASLIRPSNPLDGLKMLAIADSSLLNSANRNPGIPAAAVDKFDGTSLYKFPGASASPSLVYDNASGRILTWNDQAVAHGTFSIAGHISGWSASTKPVSPIGSIGISLILNGYAIAPSSTSYGCWNDAIMPQHSGVVTYLCVYPPKQSSSSSVTVTLTGMTLSLSSRGDKVCQFSKNVNPYVAEELSRGYTNQNFAVVRGDVVCPSESSMVQL